MRSFRGVHFDGRSREILINAQTFQVCLRWWMYYSFTALTAGCEFSGECCFWAFLAGAAAIGSQER